MGNFIQTLLGYLHTSWVPKVISCISLVSKGEHDQRTQQKQAPNSRQYQAKKTSTTKEKKGEVQERLSG